MKYLQTFIDCESPVTSNQLKQGIDATLPSARDYTRAKLKLGLLDSSDQQDRNNPEDIYQGSTTHGLLGWFMAGGENSRGDRGFLEDKRSGLESVMPSEFGGGFGEHQEEALASKADDQREWRFVLRSEGLTGAFGKKKHDPDREDTGDDPTDKHVVAMARHQKGLAEKELASIALDASPNSGRATELREIVEQCEAVLKEAKRSGELKTRSRQQNINDAVRKDIDNALKAIARANGDLGRYFKRCIKRPAWVLDHQGRSGWLFFDENSDGTPWDVSPIPLTEAEADAVMKKTASGWVLKWKDSSVEIFDDLKGLDYLARILKSGHSGIPCCLLRQVEVARSLLLPKFRIFGSYSPGRYDESLGEWIDEPGEESAENSRTQIIRPNSILTRHGVNPGLFKLTLAGVMRLWYDMAYRRADAYTEKGRHADYLELELIVYKLQEGINYIKRRLDIIPDIAKMNDQDYSSVSHAVGTAIDAISRKLPAMAEYLGKRVRRGRVCWHRRDKTLWFISGIGSFPLVQTLAEDAFYLKTKGRLVNCDWAEEISALGSAMYQADADGELHAIIRRTDYGNEEETQPIRNTTT